MFIRLLVCSFLVVLLSSFSTREVLSSEEELAVKNCFPFFNILGKVWEELALIFLWMYGEFTREVFRSRTFLCGVVFDYWFNLLTSYKSNHVFCIFVTLNQVLCFWEFVHFIEAIQFVGTELFIYISYNSFYFYRICSNVSSFISDFSNLSLFLLFFLNLDKGFQFHWYFWRTKFRFYWFFPPFFYYLFHVLLL